MPVIGVHIHEFVSAGIGINCMRYQVVRARDDMPEVAVDGVDAERFAVFVPIVAPRIHGSRCKHLDDLSPEPGNELHFHCQSDLSLGVAENMREAISLQGEVRALAAHGKLTGVILTILPVGIAAMMMVFSPGYMMTLYNHPYGKTLIAGAIGCLVLAQLVIRKIVDIKI